MKCSIQLGFASLNRTFHLSPHENRCTIALITIHYLYNMKFYCQTLHNGFFFNQYFISQTKKDKTAGVSLYNMCVCVCMYMCVCINVCIIKIHVPRPHEVKYQRVIANYEIWTRCNNPKMDR